MAVDVLSTTWHSLQPSQITYGGEVTTTNHYQFTLTAQVPQKKKKIKQWMDGARAYESTSLIKLMLFKKPNKNVPDAVAQHLQLNCRLVSAQAARIACLFVYKVAFVNAQEQLFFLKKKKIPHFSNRGK